MHGNIRIKKQLRINPIAYREVKIDLLNDPLRIITADMNMVYDNVRLRLNGVIDE